MLEVSRLVTKGHTTAGHTRGQPSQAFLTPSKLILNLFIHCNTLFLSPLTLCFMFEFLTCTLHFTNYTTVRRDRTDDRGGGCLLSLIHDSVTYTELPTDHPFPGFFFLFSPSRYLGGKWWSRRGPRDRVQIEERQGRDEVRCQARSVPQVPHYKGRTGEEVGGGVG